MTRTQAIAMLLGLMLLALTKRWWDPLLTDYWRGIYIGMLCGVLLGQLLERNRVRRQRSV